MRSPPEQSGRDLPPFQGEAAIMSKPLFGHDVVAAARAGMGWLLWRSIHVRSRRKRGLRRLKVSLQHALQQHPFALVKVTHAPHTRRSGEE